MTKVTITMTADGNIYAGLLMLKVKEWIDEVPLALREGNSVQISNQHATCSIEVEKGGNES